MAKQRVRASVAAAAAMALGVAAGAPPVTTAPTSAPTVQAQRTQAPAQQQAPASQARTARADVFVGALPFMDAPRRHEPIWVGYKRPRYRAW